MSAESFRKSEAYCREQAETSVVPEKWLEKANEWAALAEKLEQREQVVSESAGQDNENRVGTAG